MKNIVQKSAIAVVSSLALLLPQTVLAETIRFTVTYIYGCDSSGCRIEVKSQSGKEYRVEYSERIGIEKGDTVLIEFSGDSWQYITNPNTNRTANITNVY